MYPSQCVHSATSLVCSSSPQPEQSRHAEDDSAPDDAEDWTDFVEAEQPSTPISHFDSRNEADTLQTSDGLVSVPAIKPGSTIQESVNWDEVSRPLSDGISPSVQADDWLVPSVAAISLDKSADLRQKYEGQPRAPIPLDIFRETSSPSSPAPIEHFALPVPPVIKDPRLSSSLIEVNEVADVVSQEKTQSEDVQDSNVTAEHAFLEPHHTLAWQESPVRGFDTLDYVQRYAVGALAVVLLSRHARNGDLNGAAFAAAQGGTLLNGLGLRPGQQAALLALDPDDESREHVVQECITLVGDHATRFGVVQAMLALAISGGIYDARSRAFLRTVACAFHVDWANMAAVELAVAIQLLEEAMITDPLVEDDIPVGQMDTHNNTLELENSLPHPQSGSPRKDVPHARRTAEAALASRRKKKLKAQRALKVSGITLVGGILFGVTGGLIAPALLSALAGIGVAGAAGLAATGATASGAVVGSLFGVAGAGLSGRKARRRIGMQLEEFDFERSDDPRVIEARRRAAERKAAKARKAARKNAVTATAKDARADTDVADCSVPPVLQIEAPNSEPCSRIPTVSSIDSSDEENLPAQVSGGGFDGSTHVDVRGSTPNSVTEGTNSTADGTDRSDDAGLSEDDTVCYKDDDDICHDDDDDGDSDTVNDNAETESKKKKKSFFRFRRKSNNRNKAAGTKEKGVNVGIRGLDAIGRLPSLHVCICVPGWLQDRKYGSSLTQFEEALKENIPCSQHIALRWESRRLYEMSLAFAKFWASKATVTTIQQAYPHAVAAASSVAGAVAFAFALPLTIISCLDYIDNPWSVLLSRANVTGEALADVLVERSYGQRPVTLVGYSLGARVVFKCLESLASRNALGIVENVLLLGAPVSADPERWKRVTPVVAGRIINGYLSIDWALAFFHRGCGHGVYVAGLRRIAVDGVENLDLTLLGVDGHRELKDSIPRAFYAMGLGTGYIIMPPAPLIPRRKGHTAEEEDAFVTALDSMQTQVVVNGTQIAMEAQNFECSRGPGERILAIEYEEKDGDVTVEPQSSFAVTNEVLSTSDVDGIANNRSATDAKTRTDLLDVTEGSTKLKKNKKRSWLPSLGIWSSSPSGERAKSLSEQKDNTERSANDLASRDPTTPRRSSRALAVEPNSSIRRMDESEFRADENDASDLCKIESSTSDCNTVDFVEQGESGHRGRGNSSFDWDLQHRIWEEQERQMSESGAGDVPIEIETYGRVVLGISVEVTGRRLKTFLSQDAELPVLPVTEVYTNCVDEQLGVSFKLYEHEKRTKTVPLSSDRKNKYPKLLGELSLRWQTAVPKGKLRLAMTMSADELGNVIAKAEVRSTNDSLNSETELYIPRSKLCTFKERCELEAAEAKRISEEEALRTQEHTLMLPAPAEPVLALPAPGISDEREKIVENHVGCDCSRSVSDKNIAGAKTS